MYIEHNLQKALCDRIYEKRKPAALQLEQVVRKAIESNNTQLVDGIISELSRDFAYALRHPNYRNGGLIGLAAVAIALGQDLLPNYLDDIIQPILTCFGDADSRVRYYACESLYNVAKIAKSEILTYFNEIFDALCKLTADTEESVRTGANLVDQLLRDIIIECTSNEFEVDKQKATVPEILLSPNGPERSFLQNEVKERKFTLKRFIPLLVERIYVLNPATRMFLAQWILLLDSIPMLELVKYVPEFLEGLLLFLSDTHREVRIFTKTCLDTLLSSIKSTAIQTQPIEEANVKIDAGIYHIGQDTYISYPQIVDIVLSKMDPSQTETRLVALGWIDGILSVSPIDVFAKLGALILLLIPALSDEIVEIRDSGKFLNDKLLDLISNESFNTDTASTLRSLGNQLEIGDKVTRLASLNWISTLYKNRDMSSFREFILTRLLLAPLSDPSDEVVQTDLQVIALIFKDAPPNEFKILGRTILNSFNTDQSLFANRGKLVFLQLSVLLSPPKIFEVISKLCGDSLNDCSSEFYLLVIQNLNNILLTAPELHEFRVQLMQLHTEVGAKLFTTLFNSWIRNSVAVLALCLLAGAYEPAFSVLESLARNDVNVSTLIQIDRLIQYIEGPVFALLRMHLLEPHEHPFLYKVLYGLLMVLPQSPSFSTLKTRLHSISPIVNLPLTEVSLKNKVTETERKPETPLVDWNKLLNVFRKIHCCKK